ncbi:hypothetical protein [Shewanella sp. 8A]|uniref:hypothetical protein n=1 Tax=Shewanella sp. 8A TaxID=2943323 RepID=UPI00201A98BD|nr:hypothetical protein [Shewanella sp. 8A]
MDFMTTCPKCQKEYLFVVSKGASNKCPKCAKRNAITGVLSIVLVIVIIGIFYSSDNSELKNDASASHQQTVNRQFSSWDGSHSGLVKVVKANLKDPSSFEHIKTQYVDKYNYLVVTMQYRGKNSFGAVVTEEVVAKTDMNGNVLEIIK